MKQDISENQRVQSRNKLEEIIHSFKLKCIGVEKTRIKKLFEELLDWLRDGDDNHLKGIYDVIVNNLEKLDIFYENSHEGFNLDEAISDFENFLEKLKSGTFLRTSFENKSIDHDIDGQRQVVLVSNESNKKESVLLCETLLKELHAMSEEFPKQLQDDFKNVEKRFNDRINSKKKEKFLNIETNFVDIEIEIENITRDLNKFYKDYIMSTKDVLKK